MKRVAGTKGWLLQGPTKGWGTKRGAVSPDRSTILAYDRTRLAYQRTMLSWMRTGTSLITFGVAIYNFHQFTSGDQPGNRLIGPHEFGLIMVGIGLVALLLAMLEYRRDIRTLTTQ
jgi:putative membrane protein